MLNAQNDELLLLAVKLAGRVQINAQIRLIRSCWHRRRVDIRESAAPTMVMKGSIASMRRSPDSYFECL
jgi:hypothetical protein